MLYTTFDINSLKEGLINLSLSFLSLRKICLVIVIIKHIGIYVLIVSNDKNFIAAIQFVFNNLLLYSIGV